MRRGMPSMPAKWRVSNVRWKPMRNSQKCHRPSVSLSIRPVAYGNVVEVRDHEVRVGQLPVERHDGEHDSREAGDQELEEEADAEEHRYAEAELAAPDGPEPVEDLYAGGDADQHRRGGEEDVAGRRHPDAEHVVRPHAEADEADRTRGGDHYLV